jgi:hypothetical protein
VRKGRAAVGSDTDDRPVDATGKDQLPPEIIAHARLWRHLDGIAPDAPERAHIVGNAIRTAAMLAAAQPATAKPVRERRIGRRRSDLNLRQLREALAADDAGRVEAAAAALTFTDITRLADHGVLRGQLTDGTDRRRLIERIRTAELNDPQEVPADHAGWPHQPAQAIGRIVLHMLVELDAYRPGLPVVTDWREGGVSYTAVLRLFFEELGIVGNARGVAQRVEADWEPSPHSRHEE